MEGDESPPQLQGVVIITLPPPDNPSLGKTITAFTLSETPSPPPAPPPPPPPPPLLQPDQSSYDQQPQQLPPVLPPQNPHPQFSIRGILLWSPKIVLGFLSFAVFALLVGSMLSSSTYRELRNSREDDRKPGSFIYPLFPKLGVRDMSQRRRLKLGRFAEEDLAAVVGRVDDAMDSQKVADSVPSSVPAMESSTFFTVSGTVYPDGLYFTSMLVGSPPRPYFLDIDTGSDLTWIQCDAPCTSCAKGPHPLYKPTRGKIVPSKDSMCKEVQKNSEVEVCRTCQQCDYEIKYADHSSSMGVLSKDDFHLVMANESLVKQNVVFGCGYDQQGLLLDSLVRTDGILGLSRAKVSLPYQLATQGTINNVVGHCLSIDPVGGGYMFLGDDFVPNRGMAWAPMLNTPSISLYHTEMVKLSYGSKQLSLGGLAGKTGRKVVFDSGSSYSYLTKKAYSELISSIKDVYGQALTQDTSDPTLPICWHWQEKHPIRSVEEVKQFFKPLNLQFGSKWWVIPTKFQIPPEGYLIISNKGNVCLGILDGTEVDGGSTLIIGDVSLRGKLVVYDNVNQKIGWAKSNCPKPRAFESSSYL